MRSGVECWAKVNIGQSGCQDGGGRRIEVGRLIVVAVAGQGAEVNKSDLTPIRSILYQRMRWGISAMTNHHYQLDLEEF